MKLLNFIELGDDIMTVKEYFFEKKLEWEFLSKFDHFAYQKLYKVNR